MESILKKTADLNIYSFLNGLEKIMNQRTFRIILVFL